MRSKLTDWLIVNAHHATLLVEILIVVVVGVALFGIIRHIQRILRGDTTPRKSLPLPSQLFARLVKTPPAEPQVCTVCEQPGTPRLQCFGQDRAEYALLIFSVAFLTL